MRAVPSSIASRSDYERFNGERVAYNRRCGGSEQGLHLAGTARAPFVRLSSFRVRAQPSALLRDISVKKRGSIPSLPFTPFVLFVPPLESISFPRGALRPLLALNHNFSPCEPGYMEMQMHAVNLGNKYAPAA